MSNRSASRPPGWHAGEGHGGSTASRLNWLRAGVLGANDGIVSTAALVVGVAAATTEVGAIATAGFAGLLAGAVSMALGEYVSVSTQRDTERALIARETDELARMPDEELSELGRLLQAKGLSPELSETVAAALSENDALTAHLDIELGIDREDMANPWAAAGASAVAFTVGAILPLLAILLPPASSRIVVTFISVVLALTATGALSARLGGSPLRPAIIRLVVGGSLAMVVTFGIGALFNATVG